MNKDIQNRKDIENVVTQFYLKVRKDNLIGPIFNAVISDWEYHLPIMFDFWETLLFAKKAYKGNPLLKHAVLHKKHPLNKTHFDQWLNLWEETLNEHHSGTKCEEAKLKAKHISSVMLSHFAPKSS